MDNISADRTDALFLLRLAKRFGDGVHTAVLAALQEHCPGLELVPADMPTHREGPKPILPGDPPDPG